MSGLVRSRVVPLQVVHGGLRRPAKLATQPIYGIALLDRHGNLLGASTAPDLPGEVEMPPGVDLRTQDLRRYLAGEGVPLFHGRRFSLVSAAWVQVRTKRVRVGVYMEQGGTAVSPEGIEPDTGSIAAILSSQVAG